MTKIDELPTPCVLVDLDLLERNIQKMAEFCRSKNCNVRPHVKSHKSPFIAKKQIDAGAIGVCCQTLIEAESMIMNGIEHVLLTHILASKDSFDRFLALARNGDIMVNIDGKENAELLASAARHKGLSANIVVEVNVGNNKTGQGPGELAARFSQCISNLEGLRFRGIQGYEGHLQLSKPNFEERKKEAQISLQKITDTISALKKLGLDPEIVTCGGTGTYNISRGHRNSARFLYHDGRAVLRDRTGGERLCTVHECTFDRSEHT